MFIVILDSATGKYYTRYNTVPNDKQLFDCYTSNIQQEKEEMNEKPKITKVECKTIYHRFTNGKKEKNQNTLQNPQ